MGKIKNYWVSWYHKTEYSDFESTNPWGVSGVRVRDDAAVICMAIKAGSVEDAKRTVYQAYDAPPGKIEFRFVNQREAGWIPFNSRFKKLGWMIWEAEEKG